MQIFLGTKVLLDYWQMKDFAGMVTDPAMAFYVGSAIFYIQTILAFVVVLTKRPEDCFMCFNRIGPKRNYSIYQYPVEDRVEDSYSRIIREQES